MIYLEIRPSRNGRGTFAKVPILEGSVVWDWTKCRRYTADQLPNPYPAKDSYLQVAPNLYIGPDGGPEEKDDPGDVVNHSCDPNCKIVIYGSGLFQPVVPCSICLVALRDILAGEEITYDYAATMSNDPWTMKCNCGSPACRKVIGAP